MRGAWEEPPTLAEAASLPESGAWSTGDGGAPGSALAGHLELIPAPFGAPGPTATLGSQRAPTSLCSRASGNGGPGILPLQSQGEVCVCVCVWQEMGKIAAGACASSVPRGLCVPLGNLIIGLLVWTQ